MTEPKFMTPAHRRAYLTHLNRCKAMDSYHRALIYTLTAVPALRNNIDGCFDFEKDEIKLESLAAGWQTTGTTKLTRFAYNLWNGYDDKSCTPYDLFDCSFAPYMYEGGETALPGIHTPVGRCGDRRCPELKQSASSLCAKHLCGPRRRGNAAPSSGRNHPKNTHKPRCSRAFPMWLPVQATPPKAPPA